MISASALLFQDYLTEATLQVQTPTHLQYAQKSECIAYL